MFPDTAATVELFGPGRAVDEIAYQVVFDGTSQEINFDRALPMIQFSQKYAGRRAAMFVGAQLDSYTTLERIPDRSKIKKFGNRYVRVLGIGGVNTVNVSVSIGHKPTSN